MFKDQLIEHLYNFNSFLKGLFLLVQQMLVVMYITAYLIYFSLLVTFMAKTPTIKYNLEKT